MNCPFCGEETKWGLSRSEKYRDEGNVEIICGNCRKRYSILRMGKHPYMLYIGDDGRHQVRIDEEL